MANLKLMFANFTWINADMSSYPNDCIGLSPMTPETTYMTVGDYDRCAVSTVVWLTSQNAHRFGLEKIVVWVKISAIVIHLCM